ncbi:MAG: peptidase C40 [Hydrogenophilales bacterium 16-64-46]|nr:MAG: peptidase C40 [Hydrogenophilales bacterium 12-64-13]OYZ04985.1 MAG: peptidase C40 [Hydrogenophilales bacterium 16-64-46]OZA37629.1 MAG: peptidase C40 [Hydrogenophilales bacterium 17-64-34]HQT01086.1 NlpC/P60 family protein [Thiobacillus sp.]
MRRLFLLTLLFSPAAAAELPDEVPFYAVSLVGSPYKLGGDSPETGLDCSGFVGHVFRTTLGLALPRDSRAISESARPLSDDELRPGDLVFFNTLDRAYSHVGIYLGERRFVHAASSRTGSVVVSRMDEQYWQSRYEGGRRVALPDAPPQD